MNTQEYISSGVLELYALDMLSSAERREVWLLIQKHPELKSELEKIELALESSALEHRKTPSANVRTALLNQFKEEQPAAVIPIKKNSWVKPFSVAASLLLMISIAYNVFQHNELKDASSQIADLRNERSVLADQSQQFKTQFENADEKIKLFQNPDIQNVLIKGSELSPESYAYVSFNKATKQISLSGISLPDEGDNNSYQLWALVDGVPVDLGIFDSKDSLINLTKTIDSPDAFAVTLQDKGGNPTPNLDQLFLIGNV